MCVKCAFPPVAAHWTDAGAATARDRVDARARRLRIMKSVLGAEGVDVEYSALGSGIRLTAQGRDTRLAASLDDIWPLADQLLRAPFDPLSSRFTQSSAEIR